MQYLSVAFLRLQMQYLSAIRLMTLRSLMGGNSSSLMDANVVLVCHQSND